MFLPQKTGLSPWTAFRHVICFQRPVLQQLFTVTLDQGSIQPKYLEASLASL
jgi:hypothetical protein